MPKTRQRSTPKKQALKSGGRNTHSKADIMRINGAYQKKYEHYSTYELEQLENILAAKSEKGTYLHALLQVIKAKKTPKRVNAADMLSSEPSEPSEASVDSIETPVEPLVATPLVEST